MLQSVRLTDIEPVPPHTKRLSRPEREHIPRWQPIHLHRPKGEALWKIVDGKTRVAIARKTRMRTIMANCLEGKA